MVVVVKRRLSFLFFYGGWSGFEIQPDRPLQSILAATRASRFIIYGRGRHELRVTIYILCGFLSFLRISYHSRLGAYRGCGRGEAFENNHYRKANHKRLHSSSSLGLLVSELLWMWSSLERFGSAIVVIDTAMSSGISVHR